MPVLFNHEARLLVAPTVTTVDQKTGKRRSRKFSGQASNPLRILPGRNRIDKAYWEEVKNTAAVKQWCKKDRFGKCMIEYIPDEDMPDPGLPPAAADLAEMSLDELKQGLNHPDTPVEWGKVIQEEIDRRAIEEQNERVRANLPPAPPGGDGGTDHLATFLGMKADDLISEVAKMDDTTLLMELVARDERVTVKRAVEARILELNDDGGEGGDGDGG